MEPRPAGERGCGGLFCEEDSLPFGSRLHGSGLEALRLGVGQFPMEPRAFFMMASPRLGKRVTRERAKRAGR